MNVDLLVCAILSVIITVGFYYVYASKHVNFLVSLLTLLIWFITIFSILILPNDIYYDSVERDYDMKTSWEILYWTIYVLSWLILPIIQEYELGDGFTFREKFLIAIKRNLMTYGIFMGLFLVLVVYLLVVKDLSTQNIIAVLTSLSNAWGILLIIILNGYGLVAFPRMILSLSNISNRAKYLEYRAGYVYYQQCELEEKLKTMASVISLI